MRHKVLFYVLVGMLTVVVLFLVGQAVVFSQAPDIPMLSVSATCGIAGNAVTVIGSNFNANAIITARWSGMMLGTDPARIQADALGGFTFVFVVPNDYYGPHVLEVTDGPRTGERTAQVTINLQPVCAPATLTPTPSVPTPTPTATATATRPTPVAEVARLFCEPEWGLIGQTITIRGENFHAGFHFYQMRWDGVVIPWAPEGLTVGGDGKFVARIVVPNDTYSLHTVIADDGAGYTAVCYLDLRPSDPTPTWTPTMTRTPQPTATWTPGAPPNVTVTPTLTPEQSQYCAEADGVFTVGPYYSDRIEAGIAITNTNVAWETGQLIAEVWMYRNLSQQDTGMRYEVPGLQPGQSTTIHMVLGDPTFPTWYQVRFKSNTGDPSPCVSDWFLMKQYQAVPNPPAILLPADGTWMNTRDVGFSWESGGVPIGAGGIVEYEFELTDMRTGDITTTSLRADQLEWAETFMVDFPEDSLAWRVRARNIGGWSDWSSIAYFGIDSTAPDTELMTVAGEPGDNEWWRSPLDIRMGADDPAGSGVEGTFFQQDGDRWVQILRGGINHVDREGQYSVRGYAQDMANNRSEVAEDPIKLDMTPPEVELVFPAMVSTGWYTHPIEISMTGEDAVSGVSNLLIHTGSNPFQENGLVLGVEGRYSIEYYARDIAGNESGLQQSSADLDFTRPTGDIAVNGSLCQMCDPAIVTVTTGDAVSGVANWTLAISDTMLAAGNEAQRDVELDGSVWPAGALNLRLIVQDAANWLTNETVSVQNDPYDPGAPTPTPIINPTATLWPTATRNIPPYVTITPTATRRPYPTATRSSNSSGGGSGSGSSGSGAVPYYPVGYVVDGMPYSVVLPVTGEESSSAAAWYVGGLAFMVLGVLGLCILQVKRS
jgi:hypothetical protein